MNKQRGFIDIDFGAVFITLLVIGGVLGFGLNSLLSWAWPYVKAWIHTITG